MRPALWVLHLALPMLALWLLIGRPSSDVRWEHHHAHFGLVVATAVVNVGLGLLIIRAASRRHDARLFLVALGFLVAAGFLGLHALATPGVFLEKNAGFQVATPVGLFLAAVLAAASSIEYGDKSAATLFRLRVPLLGLAGAVLLGWAVWSLGGFAPLDRPITPEESEGPLLVTAYAGAALYGGAAIRYYLVYRRRPAVMLISIITAFVILAEAMFSVAYGRSWRASWWEWHVLMTVAFAYVAYSAYVQYRREGSPLGLFHGVALSRTVEQIRQDHAAALDELATAMRRHAEGQQDRELARVAAGIAKRFDLTERQLEVLERGADALALEQTQRRRLGALVRVGRQAMVISKEDDLLTRAMAICAEAFAPDRLALRLVSEVDLDEPLAGAALRSLEAAEGDEGRRYVVPLDVKGHAAGILEATRDHGAFSESDRSLLRSLASQLSIVLENARLYHQLDGLFRTYMSPDVATALLADPDQAGLGGSEREVSVLMADLRGFTPFAEMSTPEQVVAMLNAYYGAIVPVILDEGGTLVQFVGDAVMAVFNAPTRQPDHARRAARAGLRMQEATAQVAAGRAEWPRFRVGVNSGPALVGNVGSVEFRNFACIGDTTNLAARLEGLAEPGQVVIGPTTRLLLDELADVTSLGPVTVKGKRDPLEAFVLRRLRS
ncbi:adenylate/guanylate cyclase domain-containing protein [Nocardioides immobilis]|uniref:Adenylate/guanylate cyclase domain-containing protein n=1 Tax=Nocardioides immobilis TaxID=2049295 RepID=A0A417Y481_9ACTN|nr:adenylate/guanylate cyclase domain-containing protein [Nocardioides immobilis]